MKTDLSAKLLAWYAKQARALPWRDHPDPYAVWVAEVMLQQTRVKTVKPYFQRWMERFPDVQHLAQASLQEVLALWEGLGYYSRARNLHRAAQLLVAEHGGKLPSSAAGLRKLPGIGRYTAGAIASMAFKQDEPVLDGNIRRVLARLFNVTELYRSPAGERRLWTLAREHLPPGQAGDYNQALMDLGALVCTPRAPDCAHCPLSVICLARQMGIQEQRPRKAAKPRVPHYRVAAAVIHRGGEVLIAQRPNDGLLGGLWEFPGGKAMPGEDLASCLQREIREELDVDIHIGKGMGVYRHAYTHFRVTLYAFTCSLPKRREPRAIVAQALRWVALAELPDYPMGKIDRQIADKLLRMLV